MKSKNIYEHLTEISNSRGRGIKQLRDGMTLEFLRKRFAWLFSANIDEAIIGYDEEKRKLVWYGGEFNQGSFDGIFLSGIFRGGSFKGEFKGGSFMNGNIINCTFSYGDFYNGTFRGRMIDGNFYNGTFKGTFENGYFENGTFMGKWIDGEWVEGSIYSKKFGTYVNSFVDPKRFEEIESQYDDREDFINKVSQL